MRTSDPDPSLDFQANPLAWLTQARQTGQAIAVVREHGPVFTQHDEAVRTVAVFGADQIRHVLTSPDNFAMPDSASGRLGLSPTLARLSRSLHSLSGERHSEHRRVLGAVLGSNPLDAQMAIATMSACVHRWKSNQAQPLLSRMRELCICLASQHLLGADAAPELPELLYRYFYLRRQASSPTHVSPPDVKENLQSTGARLDKVLREHLRRRGDGILAGLMDTGGANLSEDEAVGHANILFVSATEPVAVALTWTLLLLSQQPRWRDNIRIDAQALEHVQLESLRMLPPNTFMSRIATRSAAFGGTELPPRTEVVICPFVEHRDGNVFADPDVFIPERWRDVRPTAFQFMPFGAGTHSCIGRSMGMDLLRTALAFLIQRFDIVLDTNQEVDWYVHTMLLPRQEVRVRFTPAGAGRNAGSWSGALSSLVKFS